MPRYVKVIIGVIGFFVIYTLWMFLLPSKFELKEQIEISASVDDVKMILLDEDVRNEWISWQYNDSESTLNSEQNGDVYYWESAINNTQGTFQIELLQNETVNVDVEFLKDVIPTAENIAIHFWDIIEPKIENGELHEIKLFESERNFVIYRGAEIERPH